MILCFLSCGCSISYQPTWLADQLSFSFLHQIPFPSWFHVHFASLNLSFINLFSSWYSSLIRHCCSCHLDPLLICLLANHFNHNEFTIFVRHQISCLWDLCGRFLFWIWARLFYVVTWHSNYLLSYSLSLIFRAIDGHFECLGMNCLTISESPP